MTAAQADAALAADARRAARNGKATDPYRVWQGSHFGPTWVNTQARASNTQAPRIAK